MEKYYSTRVLVQNDDTLKEEVFSFGEFYDSEEAFEVADRFGYYHVWSEECLEGTNNSFKNAIEKFNLEDGKHRYLGLDESGELHLIGTMDCISEADEVTDAMEECIVNIYSSDRILNLHNQFNEILSSVV